MRDFEQMYLSSYRPGGGGHSSVEFGSWSPEPGFYPNGFRILHIDTWSLFKHADSIKNLIVQNRLAVFLLSPLIGITPVRVLGASFDENKGKCVFSFEEPLSKHCGTVEFAFVDKRSDFSRMTFNFKTSRDVQIEMIRVPE